MERILKKWDILLVAFVIFLINTGLSSYLINLYNQPVIQKTIFELVICLTLLIIGKHIALKLDFPIWWRRDENITKLRQAFRLIGLGLLSVILNSSVYYISKNQLDISNLPWLDFKNITEVIFLSLRAGITEEIIYRLFAFSFITYLFSKGKSPNKYALITGIVISSIIFGVVHGSGFFIASIQGVLLAYVYYKNGLIPAIIIHFLADAVPWTLLLYYWR